MAPAPTARQGRRGGGGLSSRILGGGSERNSTIPDADIGMADATSGGTEDKRVRSGRRPGSRQAIGSSRSAPLASTSPRGPYSVANRTLGLKNGRSPTAVKGIMNKSNVSKDIGMAGAIETLKKFLLSRWNADSGLLDLANMSHDPVFKSSSFRAPGQRGAPKNSAPAMWKLVGEVCPNIKSLSLASNNLSTLTDLAPAALVRYLPTLHNLSLQGNALTQFTDLNPLSTVAGTVTGSKPGLGGLRELILADNPLSDREMKDNPHDYQAEVRRRFPSLLILDMKPIDQTIPIPTLPIPANGVNIAGLAKRKHMDTPNSTKAAGRRTKAILPLSANLPFSDSETSRSAMSAFLAKFFTTYDDHRANVAVAYAPEANFSLCVNSTVSERSRRLQHLNPDEIAKQRELTWASYLGPAYESAASAGGNQENFSRNFLRLKNSQRREETLHIGASNIVKVLQKLPRSAHPLSDPGKFVVDTWQQGGSSPLHPDVLVVCVHGEFTELPIGGRRSFDRTFILAPSKAGSACAEAGWPCEILSDMFTIRNWTNPEAWRVDAAQEPSIAITAAPQASASASASAADVVASPSITPEQQVLMSQLHAATQLNAQFCYQCLSETGWNLPNALVAFGAAKASIPPEAFL